LYSHRALRVWSLAFRTPAFAQGLSRRKPCGGGATAGRTSASSVEPLSSSSKAVVSSKDWLNSGYKDYGDLDNDGNSLTASSGEEDAQTAENFKMADAAHETE
jgi:hypothetical protein